jgi:hypothetical protein
MGYEELEKNGIGAGREHTSRASQRKLCVAKDNKKKKERITAIYSWREKSEKEKEPAVHI